MDDLIIITLIVAIALLTVAIRLFSRRRKMRLISSAGMAKSSSTPAIGLEIEGSSMEHEAEIIISFGKSGVQYRWIETNTSLLEFTESRGIEVESLCRAGECGSCRTRLVEGEVEYIHPPGINPGRGSCLLCISRPKSNLHLDL